MEAFIERDGTVTMTFNIQGEKVQAPPDETGARRHYLPCDGNCGDLLTVAWNVVSATCPGCLETEAAEWDDGPDAICRYCGTTFSGVGDDCGGCRLDDHQAAEYIRRRHNAAKGA